MSSCVRRFDWQQTKTQIQHFYQKVRTFIQFMYSGIWTHDLVNNVTPYQQSMNH